MHNPTLITAIRWLIIIAMPFFLGLGTMRAVIAWDYPSFEYARIAPDPYGFTLAERLQLAHATLDYLQRPEPASEVIYLLEELRLPGSDDPLYNEREIGHMLDVKIVADAIKRVVQVTAVIVLGGLLLLLLRANTRPVGYRALLQGGIATVAVLAVIAVLVLFAWQFFFVQFHELLFPPDTWTFAYSDSLIRLFPEQFWFDVGVIMSVLPLIEGVLVALIGWALLRQS